MTIRWGQLAEAVRSRFQGLSERERYAYFLALQLGRAVGVEGEDAEASDGAAGVTLALCAATGIAVRADAGRLMREVFTENSPQATSIQAAFFVTRKNREVGGEIARKGTATHVAGVVGRGVVMSFEHPRACFRTVEELWTLCGLWDYDLRLRGLDRGALERVAREGEGMYGSDAVVRELFEEERV